jgi:hypothetical protein
MVLGFMPGLWWKMGRRGDVEIWRYGDLEIWRRGDGEKGNINIKKASVN